MNSCGVATSSDENTLEEVSQINVELALKDISGLKSIKEYIDWEHLRTEVLKQSNEIDESLAIKRYTSFKDGFNVENIFSSVDLSDVLYRPTKTYFEGGKKHIVAELYSGEEFQFFDFEIDTLKGKVTDSWVYGIGESISTIMMNYVFSELEDGFTEYMAWYSLSKKSYESGYIQRSWNELMNVPEEYQSDFPFRVLKLKIAESDPDLLSDLRQEMKNEGFRPEYIVYLSLIESILIEDPVRIKKEIATLKKSVGESASLNIFEGYALTLEGDFAGAHSMYENVITLSPSHLAGYINDVELYIMEENQVKTADVISKANRALGKEVADWLAFFPEHQKFIKSAF